MRSRNARLSIVLILTLAAAGVACKKPPETKPEPAESAKPAPPVPPPAPAKQPEPDWQGEKIVEQPPTVDEMLETWNEQGVLKTVYFGYDSSELSEDSRRTLQANADWLKAHGDVKVLIEGHCDERGTIEYNVDLGQKRAASIRDYLTGLGLTRGRMRIITYGEERPEDPGHAESAWVKNRRAEFLLER